MQDLIFRRTAGGFTLIETMCALAVAGILSSLAYPSYVNVMHRVRRADALVAAMQVQMAQERHRAEHALYGTLTDLRMADSSPAGHYKLTVTDITAAGYELRAEAKGMQGGDKGCRHMRLVVEKAQVLHASGPDELVANSAAANRQCWGL